MNNGPFKEVLDAATTRLRGDAELCQEVRHELQGHLEDSLEACRAAGRNDEECRAAAIRAFGDPREIAEKLWRANLRRMRLRAVVKWAARVSLLPVLLALLLMSYAQVASYVGTMTNLIGGMSGNARNRVSSALVNNWIVHTLAYYSETPRFKAPLTADQELLWSGDRSAESRAANALPLVAAHPDDPVYYGHYATMTVHEWGSCFLDTDAAGLAKAVAVLDRGEQIEPNNAFYNYMKAVLLFEKGADQADDKAATYSYIQDDGKAKETPMSKLIIRDRALVDRALAEIRKGNSKPYYTSHEFDFQEQRLALLRTPNSLLDEVQQISIAAGMLLPDLARFRYMTRCAVGAARLLIAEGRRDEGLALLDELSVAPLKLATQRAMLIDLLVAVACTRLVDQQSAEIYRELGLYVRDVQRTDMAQGLEQVYKAARNNPARLDETEIRRTAGLLGNMIFPAVPMRDQPGLLHAISAAERSVWERLAFTIFGLAGLFLLLILTVRALVEWRKDAGGRPRRLSLGWRRTAWIIAGSVAAPLGAYLIYSRWLPFGWGDESISYAPGRFVLEMAFLGAIMIGLALTLSWHFLRRRGMELGFDVPESGRLIPVWMWIAILGLVVVYLVGLAVWWQPIASGRRLEYAILAALVLLALVGGALVVSYIRLFLFPDEYLLFRRAVIRSLLPLLAIVFVTLLACAQLYSHVEERHYVRALAQPGQRLFLDEVDMTYFSDLRDYLQREHVKEMQRQAAARLEGTPHELQP